MTIGCMSLKMMVLLGFRDFRNAQVCNAMSLLDERARALLNYADPRDLTLRLKQEKHPARTRGSDAGVGERECNKPRGDRHHNSPVMLLPRRWLKGKAAREHHHLRPANDRCN